MSFSSDGSNKIAKIVIALVAIFFIGFSGFVLANTTLKSGRPSKQEMVKKLMLQSGLTGDEAKEFEEYYSCIVDHIHSKLSYKAIDELMKVTEANTEGAWGALSDADYELMDKATTKCEDKFPYLDDIETEEGLSAQSEAKTTLTDSIKAVKSIQTGNGDVNFSGISVETLNENEPDITFVYLPLGADSDEQTVAVIERTDDSIVMQTRSEGDAACYFAQLHVDGSTMYGTAWTEYEATCPTAPDAMNGSDYVDNPSDGWIS